MNFEAILDHCGSILISTVIKTTNPRHAIGGLRCVLTPVVGGWQIRIEDGRETVRSHVSRTSQDALAIADQWLKGCPGGTLRDSRDTQESS